MLAASYISMTRFKSDFEKYATLHNVSMANAIGDRDWPMTYTQCLTEWQLIEGSNKMPSYDEIRTMHPESEEYCSNFQE